MDEAQAGCLCVIDVRRHDWRCVGDLATGRRRRSSRAKISTAIGDGYDLEISLRHKINRGPGWNERVAWQFLAIEFAVAQRSPALGLVNAAELYCETGELGRVAARGIVGCQRLVTFFDGASSRRLEHAGA